MNQAQQASEPSWRECSLKSAVNSMFGEIPNSEDYLDRIDRMAERHKDLVAERDNVETPFLKQVADQIQFYRDLVISGDYDLLRDGKDKR